MALGKDELLRHVLAGEDPGESAEQGEMHGSQGALCDSVDAAFLGNDRTTETGDWPAAGGGTWLSEAAGSLMAVVPCSVGR